MPLIVINGRERDPELAAGISADRRLRVATLEHADLPAALHCGRRMVDTTWFAELDDDDVLMPGALSTRVDALENDHQCHAVVTNGIRRGIDGDTLHFVEDASTIEADAVRAMFRYSWLLPGCWLCEPVQLRSNCFEDIPDFVVHLFGPTDGGAGLRLKFLDCQTA